MTSMISTTASYALRAALFLAEREGEGPVRVGRMARTLDVPRNYLSKVLHTLAKEGLLQSLRGPRGGFELARPAASVTLHDVVSPFDEIEGRGTCLLGRGECDPANPCALHGQWSEVAADVGAFFRETVLSEVVGNGDRVKAILGD